MAKVSTGDVHVNAPLTNVSIAYLQSASDFIASRVFPNLPVGKRSDRYYTYDRGEFNRDDMEERAPATESAGSEYSIDNTPTYYCKVYALHHDVPDEIRANSDSMLNPDMEATTFVTQKALIKREKLWVSKYFTSGVWTSQITGVASSPSTNEVLKWSDANSNPVENIRAGRLAMKQSTGFTANKLVLSLAVYNVLVDHPDIVDRIKYSGGVGPSNPAIVTLQALTQLFEVDEILIMSAIENTAKEGLTASHSFIGGNHALLVHAAKAPGLMTPSAGYTFSWTGMVGSGNEGNRIKRFRMEHLEADRVEIQMAFDQKLVAADLGYIFLNII